MGAAAANWQAQARLTLNAIAENANFMIAP
jgi:hypothetical protein